jgi:hypothetical protein
MKVGDVVQVWADGPHGADGSRGPVVKSGVGRIVAVNRGRILVRLSQWQPARAFDAHTGRAVSRYCAQFLRLDGGDR